MYITEGYGAAFQSKCSSSAACDAEELSQQRSVLTDLWDSISSNICPYFSHSYTGTAIPGNPCDHGRYKAVCNEPMYTPGWRGPAETTAFAFLVFGYRVTSTSALNHGCGIGAGCKVDLLFLVLSLCSPSFRSSFLLSFYYLRNNHNPWMPSRLQEKGDRPLNFRSPHRPPTCCPSLSPRPWPLESAWHHGTNASRHDTGAAGRHVFRGTLAGGRPQSHQDDEMAGHRLAGARGVCLTRGQSVHHFSFPNSMQVTRA